jgi:glyoxylase-like metal-dependent hydrolase (beta-lactamase superfamily II)
MPRLTALHLCVAVLAAASSVAAAQAPLEKSFLDARALLAKSMAAHGGAERIGQLSAARVQISATIATGLQGRRPTSFLKPDREGDADLTVLFDLAKQRYRSDGEQRNPGGFAFPFTLVYADGAVLTTNPFPATYTRRMVGDGDEGREGTAATATRMLPPLLLKLASQRLATVRDEGSTTIDGRSARRLAFNADKATRVTLSIDAETGRVLATEQLAPDPVLGIDTGRWLYAGTQTVDGLVLPQRATLMRRGGAVIEAKLVSAAFDGAAKLADADFALDPRFKRLDDVPLEVAEVRPGLWEVSGAQGGNYRMQFAELADRVVAFDAPVSPAVVRSMVAKLREKLPAKPISHAVLSHFHNDHIGGVRALADAGATIVTTAEAKDIVSRVALAPAQLLSTADAPAPELRFALVEDKLEIGDATRKLTVEVVSGNPHIERMLVLRDARNRAVSASDMYDDHGPFNAAFDAFAKWLAAQDELELLLGAHHPPSTVKSVLERQADWKRQPRG